ncbi:MAG: 30S ribosomal protein S8 [Candidatus Hydrogenedentota bacterium]
MAIHDVIGDCLTLIRNASKAKQPAIELKGSNLLLKLCELLRDEGYVANVKVTKEKPQKSIKVTLKYDNHRNPVFSSIRRVSKPSRRVYLAADDVKPVLGGMGISIVSTSQGLITDRQARKSKLGGEIICEVY